MDHREAVSQYLDAKERAIDASSIPLREANPELWARLESVARTGIVSIRFLADADLNQAILVGVREREPAIDFASGTAKAACWFPTTRARCRFTLRTDCRGD